MKKQICNPKIDNLRVFAYIHGRALSYNYFRENTKYAGLISYAPGCFTEFLQKPFAIPILLSHDENEIIGYVTVIEDFTYQMNFDAKIFDVRVFTDRNLKFSIGTENNKHDIEDTPEGVLIKKAVIKEISIIPKGGTPADVTAFEILK